jgi:glucosyl-3-phosphoglycerate synthase
MTAVTLTDPESVSLLVDAKAGQRLAVCIPARDEGATITDAVAAATQLRACGLVDEVVVVDDASSDDTAELAVAAGANVVAGDGRGGKGGALRKAVAASSAELLVFLDADVVGPTPRFVTALVAPLLVDTRVLLVKPTYRRPLAGSPEEGGRVTELLARPLLHRFLPELANAIAQPLAGETALRRSVLDDVGLDDGYRVEIGLLIDVYRRHGLDAISEVDLGERAHRNRPLRELRLCADDVLAAVLDRLDSIALSKVVQA